mmetsp:Transcript_1003/g.2083  ORF Transcript_1003/g.2083 Transcript_1003/m.2083 type:complete len:415 (-) Transcript_1003:239-1483(-)
MDSTKAVRLDVPTRVEVRLVWVLAGQRRADIQPPLRLTGHVVRCADANHILVVVEVGVKQEELVQQRPKVLLKALVQLRSDLRVDVGKDFKITVDGDVRDAALGQQEEDQHQDDGVRGEQPVAAVVDTHLLAPRHNHHCKGLHEGEVVVDVLAEESRVAWAAGEQTDVEVQPWQAGLLHDWHAGCKDALQVLWRDFRAVASGQQIPDGLQECLDLVACKFAIVLPVRLDVEVHIPTLLHNVQGAGPEDVHRQVRHLQALPQDFLNGLPQVVPFFEIYFCGKRAHDDALHDLPNPHLSLVADLSFECVVLLDWGRAHGRVQGVGVNLLIVRDKVRVLPILDGVHGGALMIIHRVRGNAASQIDDVFASHLKKICIGFEEGGQPSQTLVEMYVPIYDSDELCDGGLVPLLFGQVRY